MVYELRRWYDDADCLYTDDQRVKDLAIRSPDLQIVGTYFRTGREIRPFAWDIVGRRAVLRKLTRPFTANAAQRPAR